MFLRNKKRVIVTGGAGFLGSHLCERLLKNDCEVLCVDNLYSGSKENIVQLSQNPNFEFIRHDITFPLYLEADEIFNLACPASPLHYQRNPVQTIKTCVHGSINMPGLARGSMHLFCKLQPAKFMVIQRFIPRKKISGVELIQLVSGHAMMKVNAARKHFFSIIIDSIIFV